MRVSAMDNASVVHILSVSSRCFLEASKSCRSACMHSPIFALVTQHMLIVWQTRCGSLSLELHQAGSWDCKSTPKRNQTQLADCYLTQQRICCNRSLSKHQSVWYGWGMPTQANHTFNKRAASCFKLILLSESCGMVP